MTSKFKCRKVDLQHQGYDPRHIHDPLYVRDDRARAYVPLSPETLDRLGLGTAARA